MQVAWTLQGDLEITSVFSRFRRGAVADFSATSLAEHPVHASRILAKMCCVRTHIKSMPPTLRHKLDAFIQFLAQGLHVLLQDLYVLLLCYDDAYRRGDWFLKAFCETFSNKAHFHRVILRHHGVD